MSNFIDVFSLADFQALLNGKQKIKSEPVSLRGSSSAARGKAARPTSSVGGHSGHIKHKPYNVQPCGRYHDCTIEIGKLLHFKTLIVRNNLSGKIVMNKKIDETFIDLITRRLHRDREPSRQAVIDFKKLVKLSGMPFRPLSIKSDLLVDKTFGQVFYNDKKKTGGCNTTKLAPILFIRDPNELSKLLTRAVAQRMSLGNDSPEIFNRISSLLDELHRIGEITTVQRDFAIKRYLNV